MKKIVPFSNTLKFKTDVSEIIAISLEHKIDKEKDSISGVFYISGEYKIMDGVMNNEQFKFDLPFDIALGTNYDINTLNIDIDDFRYELIDNNKLKIDIDLFLDGEEIKDEELHDDRGLLDEMLTDNKNDVEVNIDNSNEDIKENDNNIEDNNGYVTYRVYRVNPGDTIDTIISKYEITKEDLMDYNDNLENIKPGDKLIIQSKK